MTRKSAPSEPRYTLDEIRERLGSREAVLAAAVDWTLRDGFELEPAMRGCIDAAITAAFSPEEGER